MVHETHGLGGDRGRQSMGLCSMSPGDATCSLSSSVTLRPAAPRRPEHNNRTAVTQQSGPAQSRSLNVPRVNV